MWRKCFYSDTPQNRFIVTITKAKMDIYYCKRKSIILPASWSNDGQLFESGRQLTLVIFIADPRIMTVEERLMMGSQCEKMDVKTSQKGNNLRESA